MEPRGWGALVSTLTYSDGARAFLSARGICMHCPADTRVRGIIKIPAAASIDPRRNILVAHVEAAREILLAAIDRFSSFLRSGVGEFLGPSFKRWFWRNCCGKISLGRGSGKGFHWGGDTWGSFGVLGILITANLRKGVQC